MIVGFIGLAMIATIAMCFNCYIEVNRYREEKEDDVSLTFKRYLRRNPMSPMLVVYFLFLLISFPICIILENRGININNVGFGILQIAVFLFVVFFTLYLELTKDNK